MKRIGLFVAIGICSTGASAVAFAEGFEVPAVEGSEKILTPAERAASVKKHAGDLLAFASESWSLGLAAVGESRIYEATRAASQAKGKALSTENAARSLAVEAATAAQSLRAAGCVQAALHLDYVKNRAEHSRSLAERAQPSADRAARSFSVDAVKIHMNQALDLLEEAVSASFAAVTHADAANKEMARAEGCL